MKKVMSFINEKITQAYVTAKSELNRVICDETGAIGWVEMAVGILITLTIGGLVLAFATGWVGDMFDKINQRSTQF